MPRRSKIFGIGLSKTGTTTLTQALEILGYRAVHFPRSDREIEFCDAATDAPVAAIFEQLDTRFPGSKFIYTVRDREQWLRSCEKFYSIRRRQPDDIALDLRRKFYGQAEFDRQRFAAGYERHHERVTSYFMDRPGDLLTLDICGQDAGWPALCAFLKKPVPDTPFPMANKGVMIDEIVLRLLHVVGDVDRAAAIASVTRPYAERLYKSAEFARHDPERPLSFDASAKTDKVIARCCSCLGGAASVATQLKLPKHVVRKARSRHRRRKLIKHMSRKMPLSVYWFMKRSGAKLIR